MHLQPVIERELRVLSRTRATFHLRVLAGSVAMITLSIALANAANLMVLRGASQGPWLFALLHTAISSALAVICPLMCADTLSRERREGTLGLLLLTPLKPGAVVLGKMAAHLFRALGLWLAAVPVLTVPFLMGGVNGSDLVFALGIELGVVLGSLAAGFLASCLATRWGGAIALSILFALGIGEALALVSFAASAPFLFAHEKTLPIRNLIPLALVVPWIVGTGLMENGFSGFLARNPGWMSTALVTALGSVVTASLMVFAAVYGFACSRVRQFGQMRKMPARRAAWRQFWLRARTSQWSRRRRQSQLAHDPMRWLLMSNATSWLRWWAWCGLAILFWSGLLMGGVLDGNDPAMLAFIPPIVILLMQALAAATRFRHELEDGSLEILLVTPIPPRAILQAQCRTLYVELLPAMLLTTSLALFWTMPHGLGPERMTLIILSWSCFLAIPMIGARFGVRRVGPLLGWFLTLTTAIGLPTLFAGLAAWSPEPAYDLAGSVYFRRFGTSFVLLQLTLAAVCAWLTVSDLATRRFQMKPLQRIPG
jgi:ABC-type transport system involved in cytochrome c biogenesis permease component